MDNVLATPHCGWYSEESKVEIRIKLATDIARVLNGEEPVGFVNKRELGGKQ
jgi:D-3-phosphoglycerate dehydrogenase